MCWVETKNNINVQIAYKDFKVYKIVLDASKQSCKSIVRGFNYTVDTLYNIPTVKIRPKFERYSSVMGCVGELWNYDRFYIHEGYHSYLTEEIAKGRMYSAEIGIFEIPVGATVYINYAYREVVSTDIKYLGLLEEI